MKLDLWIIYKGIQVILKGGGHLSVSKIYQKKPYILFKKYDEAIAMDQDMVEAISISSFSKELDIVDSRYVNLKIVDNEDFIFFKLSISKGQTI